MDFFRRNARRWKREEWIEDEGEIASGDFDDSVELSARRDELEALVEIAVSELNPRERAILEYLIKSIGHRSLLCYVLGISKGNLSVQWHRIRAKLIRRLIELDPSLKEYFDQIKRRRRKKKADRDRERDTANVADGRSCSQDSKDGKTDRDQDRRG